jgi:hypothetical protein
MYVWRQLSAGLPIDALPKVLGAAHLKVVWRAAAGVLFHRETPALICSLQFRLGAYKPLQDQYVDVT